MGFKFTIMFIATFMSFFGINDKALNETIMQEEFHDEAPVIVYDDRAEVELPIIMYHHITPEAVSIPNDMTITPEKFEEHIISLLDKGYTPIFLEELIAFVESGEKLPEKPICITFDDGYLSNYEYAFPVLEKYNVKANIAVIGVSIGKNEYKETNYKMIPHFSIEQAQEMENSGFISIISHTYDMHQEEFLETGNKIRVTAVKLNNETEEEYKLALKQDFEKISKILSEELKKETMIVAYPHGRYNKLSNQTLKELGVKMTLATTNGKNKIQKGYPECLYNLHRYTVHENS